MRRSRQSRSYRAGIAQHYAHVTKDDAYEAMLRALSFQHSYLQGLGTQRLGRPLTSLERWPLVWPVLRDADLGAATTSAPLMRVVTRHRPDRPASIS